MYSVVFNFLHFRCDDVLHGKKVNEGHELRICVVQFAPNISPVKVYRNGAITEKLVVSIFSCGISLILAILITMKSPRALVGC